MISRPPDKLSQVRYFARISLKIILISTIACGVFVHLVSPLRDRSFVPNSANAGSIVLPGVTESNWIFGAGILAALLATNVTLLGIANWLGHHPLIDIFQPRIRLKRIISEVIVWSIVGFCLFWGLWFVFLIYLMAQWLVD
ncbi:hypothetical protein H6F67_23600 [Microcoleus sp. FACHB-1515]|uniref:hypothetical protein n=2 Tax=Cyanophyceae TaxID=3028117 RepID=UPI0019A92DE0|nr:hypothetical protein [Microcoleus sp. FACHB-1515]MBD2092840.1 hypothetical protein [Microcoleus sp. FACHB-1515]